MSGFTSRLPTLKSPGTISTFSTAVLTSSAGLIQSPVTGRATFELNTSSIPDIGHNGEFSGYKYSLCHRACCRDDRSNGDGST